MVRGQAKLFIGQISFEADKPAIHRLFSAYGDVQDIQMLFDRETRTSRGACFITYGSTEEADTAIAALHNRYRMLSNRYIQVSYAKNSPNISPYGHHMAVDVSKRNGSNPMPGSMPTPPPQEVPSSCGAAVVQGGATYEQHPRPSYAH